ncbi:hypothetical protein ACFFRR_000004 [Megaselia abdita]
MDANKILGENADESGEESFKDKDIEEPPLKKSRNEIQWIFQQKLENIEEKETFMKETKMWSFKNKKVSSIGERVYYRCNQVKKQFRCPAEMHLLYYPNETDGIGVFTNGKDCSPKNGEPSLNQEFKKAK